MHCNICKARWTNIRETSPEDQLVVSEMLGPVVLIYRSWRIERGALVRRGVRESRFDDVRIGTQVPERNSSVCSMAKEGFMSVSRRYTYGRTCEILYRWKSSEIACYSLARLHARWRYLLAWFQVKASEQEDWLTGRARVQGRARSLRSRCKPEPAYLGIEVRCTISNIYCLWSDLIRAIIEVISLCQAPGDISNNHHLCTGSKDADSPNTVSSPDWQRYLTGEDSYGNVLPLESN